MSATHGIGGDPDDALRLAERVIEAAQAAGADEAEALVVGSESALTRFANSEIHQNVASAEVYVNLRFVKGRRIGVANTGRMDAVGDASSWQMWGTPNCGKGEPGQTGHVGHGVSGARFRNVRVGVVA